MGKGGSTPYVPPAPPPPARPQEARPVVESATAARTAQREKANKNAGIQGSILTTPTPLSGDPVARGKTLLGQ